MTGLQVNRPVGAVGGPSSRGPGGICFPAVRVTVLAVFVLLFVTGSLLAQQTSEVILGGYNEVPRVSSTGSGLIEVTLRGDSLTVSGSFTDLNGAYTSSGIYFGRPDENGNRVLQLDADFQDDSTSGEFLPEENRFVLTPQLKEGLRLGRLYINITSRSRQHGEIRGQIPVMISD